MGKCVFFEAATRLLEYAMSNKSTFEVRLLPWLTFETSDLLNREFALE